MSEILRIRRISRRQFLSRGLWTSIAAGLFSGAIFGLPGQSEKTGPKPSNHSFREARYYSRLAG